MLPSSHLAPRNLANPGLCEGLGGGCANGLLASLAAEPGTMEPPALGAGVLADAFSEFIAAAARLESSYAELQQQVAQLSHELADRNAALKASLAENERMRRALEQIVDSMPCGVLVLENDGELAMINPEGMRLLDLSLARMRAEQKMRNIEALSQHAGIDLASFVADERLAEGEQQFSVASPAGKRWIEVRNRRIGAAASVEAGSAQRAGQTILILRDVTAHKQAEQERERARRATALAEVAAMLAHEIRNPLASLELFAGLLAESACLAQGAGAEQRWVAHMRAGIRSLSGTVNNVLSFHGAGFPALTPLALAETVGSAIEFVRPIADEAGVGLYFETGAGEAEAHVLGNAGGLQQLLLNLVTNAVRHTGKGGSVWVRMRTPQRRLDCGAGRVQLECSDTGSGIAAEHLTEIFRAGFSGSGNSSGLGLAVCGQIVRQHGGEMRVSSRVGCGTTFYVELPTL